MAKKIPKKLRIGAKHYRVKKVHTLTDNRYGEINYRMKELNIAKFWQLITCKFRISKQEQWETFWHEAVHGILRDMKRHDLNNERFVNAFCKRLYQALESK